MDYLQQCLSQLYKAEQYPPIIGNLPSNGLIYKESFFNKTGKVIFKKITGKDEEFSSDPIFSEELYNMNYILEQQIYFNDNPHIPITDFIIADRDILIVLSRIMSYGHDLSGIIIQCSNCLEEIKGNNERGVTSKIEKIEIESLNSLSVFPYQDNSNVFLWKSLDKKFIIKFQLMTIGIQKSIMNKDGHMSIMDILSSTILEINGITDKDQITDIIYNDLPIIVSKQFQQYVQSVTPYIKIHLQEIICQNCNHKNDLKSKVALDLIAINNQYIKESAMSEFHFLHRQLHIPFSDLYNMPVELRKRLFQKELKFLEEERKVRDEAMKKK